MSRPRRLVALLATVGMVVACGGGGGGGGGDATDTVTLSETTALPGQVITVSEPSIAADDLVDVTFETSVTTSAVGDGYSVTVKGIAGSDGKVDIAVPPFVDPASGDFGSGDVAVRVNGHTAAQTLRIDGLLDLGAETEGAITLGVIDLAIEQYAETVANLDAIAAEVQVDAQIAAARSEIQSRIADLQAMADEIETHHTLTVEGSDGPVVLTTTQLTLLDQWQLHTIVALRNQLDSAGVPLVITASFRDEWNDALNTLAASDSTPPAIREAVRNLLVGTEESLTDALSRKVPQFLAMLSLPLTGIGLGEGPLATVASAYGIGVSHVSTFFSAVSSWWTQTNTDQFLARSREGFDSTVEALSQLARLAASYLSAAPKPLGWLGGILSGIGTAKDLAGTVDSDLCGSSGDTLPFCGGGSGTTTATFTVYSYLNFDGSQGTDGAEADLHVAGSQTFPTFSWSGNAIAIHVEQILQASEILYGIVAQTSTTTGRLIPFGSSVHYGDYSLADVDAIGDDPSPALQAGDSYVVQVQRSDFKTAALYFTVN